MRALLIVNPQATSTTVGGRDVLAHALASQTKLDVLETTYRGHAMAAARAAAREEIELVVAHGGDGTVNEVVNGILGIPSDYHAHPNNPRPALGIVPGGFANVFARALGIARDPVEATHQLLHAVENRLNRTVGLGLADQTWFTFNAGLGWDADVVAGVARRRGKQTSPGLYLRMAAASYFRPPLGRPSMTIQLPGLDPAQVRTAFVSNGDPWSYLGDRPIHLNNGCSFDRGLGLFALRQLGLFTVLRHARQALKPDGNQRGRQLIRHDDVETVYISAESLVNFQLDGDLIGQRTKVAFRSVPDALTVMI